MTTRGEIAGRAGEGFAPDWWVDRLSPREMDVASLLAAFPNQSDKWVGAVLGLSHTTVATYLGNIYGKLLIHSRWQLVVIARAVRERPPLASLPSESIGWPSGIDAIDGGVDAL